MPVQVRGQVLANRRVGAYQQLTIVAPGIADEARPGQFVALAVGGPDSALLLRRAVAIYRTSRTGVYGGTVDIVLAAHGQGTRWIAERRPHDTVDVVGPLGRPFRLPAAAGPVVLVGGGYGAAPLFDLLDAVRARGCRPHMVLGAGNADRLFGVLDAKRACDTVAITTDDGSYGRRGRVSDVLPEVLERTGARAVYACGPMPMLRTVSDLATAAGAACEVAVEESMACGIGVCMTCVLPVAGEDGRTRLVRSCLEGPVFLGERVRWDEVGRVPAVGAPAQEPGPQRETGT